MFSRSFLNFVSVRKCEVDSAPLEMSHPQRNTANTLYVALRVSWPQLSGSYCPTLQNLHLQSTLRSFLSSSNWLLSPCSAVLSHQCGSSRRFRPSCKVPAFYVWGKSKTAPPFLLTGKISGH